MHIGNSNRASGIPVNWYFICTLKQNRISKTISVTVCTMCHLQRLSTCKFIF